MTKTILRLQDISKSFSGVEVLHDVNFDLRPGEVHALLGENGAGKSTLVKVITGYHQPDHGEIYLDDELVEFGDTRDSRQVGIAAIYQELSLFPDLDVAENIFVGRHPLKHGMRVDWRKLYDEAKQLLDALGVQIDLKQKARHLSIAQQQIVEIARAFSINARILIMDEPTSSLTLNEVAELFNLVRNLRESGTAIIFISHRLEELFEIADRVTVLRDGYYIDTCNMKETTRDDLLRKMVGRTISEQYPKVEVERGDVMLQVEDITKDGLFRNVSFELHQGEILGLAGLVGAGRTNVAESLFGIKPVDSGRVLIAGQEVRITSPQHAIELGLAYVPEDRQQHGLIPAMQLTPNISLPKLDDFARYSWILNAKERKFAHTAAVQMEVRARSISQCARELSGGNQQKIVLAKWLSTNPRILILDEPTRGIDVGTKAAVHALMSHLAAQGMAILMISSELPEILGMSDRIIVMREGFITAHFRRAEATQENIIAAATQNVRIGN
ncbi:MAG: sugar ABC transporter ATP-binding protein [Brevefilum sp.]|nr:sugar ABC transporter ATP-binding protein [Brevefilum sp.]